MVPGQKSYTLKYPIETRFRSDSGERSETTSEVTVRRPKAKDMRLVDDHQHQPIALMLAMVGQLTDLEPAQVEMLDAEDAEALGELCMGFIELGPKTGETD